MKFLSLILLKKNNMKKVLILIFLALPFGLMAQGNGVPNRSGYGSGYDASNYDHEYILLQKTTKGEEITVFTFVDTDGTYKKTKKYDNLLQGLNDLSKEGYFVVCTENSVEGITEVYSVYLIKSTNKLDSKKESKK